MAGGRTPRDVVGNDNGHPLRGADYGVGVRGPGDQAFHFNGKGAEYRFNDRGGNFGRHDFTLAFFIKTRSTAHEAIWEKWLVCGKSSFWTFRMNGPVPPTGWPNRCSCPINSVTTTPPASTAPLPSTTGAPPRGLGQDGRQPRCMSTGTRGHPDHATPGRYLERRAAPGGGERLRWSRRDRFFTGSSTADDLQAGSDPGPDSGAHRLPEGRDPVAAAHHHYGQQVAALLASIHRVILG